MGFEGLFESVDIIIVRPVVSGGRLVPCVAAMVPFLMAVVSCWPCTAASVTLLLRHHE